MPQVPWMAGLMAPSSGITDYFGLYPEAPTGQGITGEKLPSFGENIQNKQYLDALYQGLGLAGDVAIGAGAVYKPSLLLGAGLKMASAAGKASKGAKYTDYVYHITPTKNVKSIKERGLDPLSESNYIKGVGGGRYQDEPMVFAFSNPLDAIQFVSRTRWETPPGWKGPIPKMRDYSIVRIKNRKEKWSKDPAQDSDWYMGDSNVAEIQALPHEERVISLQTHYLPKEDIVDITKVDDIQKELGARKKIPDVDNPDKFRYSSHPNDRMEMMGTQGQKKPPYTGREYVDNVVDIMDKRNRTGYMPSTSGYASPKTKMYHGAKEELPEEFMGFEDYASSKSSAYGDGFYTTSRTGTAKGYAGKEGKLYEVTPKKELKLFDMEQPVPPSIKQSIKRGGVYKIKYPPYKDFEMTDEFLLRTQDFLDENPKASLVELYDEMRALAPYEDIPAYEVDEYFHGFASILQESGYQGLRHKGGVLSSRPKKHEVNIYWNPGKDLGITEVVKKKAHGGFIDKAIVGGERYI